MMDLILRYRTYAEGHTTDEMSTTRETKISTVTPAGTQYNPLQCEENAAIAKQPDVVKPAAEAYWFSVNKPAASKEVLASSCATSVTNTRWDRGKEGSGRRRGALVRSPSDIQRKS